MRRLHHWPLDPWSRQARIALGEKQLEFEPVLDRFWDPSDDLLALNPAGLPPVLVDETSGGAIVVVEARAILEYLEEIKPEPALMPGSPADRAEIRRLVGWFDRKFDAEVNAYLLHEKLEKRVQALGAPDMEMIRAGRDHLRWHLDYVCALLEARDGLAGPRWTLADLAAAAHLSCIDYLGDVAWEQYPPAKAWYERIKCRPSFRPLLEDRLPGMAPVTWYADLDF
ncbi:glutathione S-transferase [Marinicauda salina]|uniref:Glutathione S-transferase n=1 Tax=Marinicauda salina TaxID=2135793 RepID=A0A2U2BWQ5_9PROT|nr:glutathione S-transferase family protein [Marinicauda salina]PWE18404.1 glutathione S-transferase [Marinicauda salina]